MPEGALPDGAEEARTSAARTGAREKEDDAREGTDPRRSTRRDPEVDRLQLEVQALRLAREGMFEVRVESQSKLDRWTRKEEGSGAMNLSYQMFVTRFLAKCDEMNCRTEIESETPIKVHGQTESRAVLEEKYGKGRVDMSY